MSGSLFSPWSRVRDPRSYAEQLARKMNCSAATTTTSSSDTAAADGGRGGGDDGDLIYDCLRSVPADRLSSARLSAPSFHTDLGPSFDGVTVKDSFAADVKGKRRNFGARYVGGGGA